MTDAAKVPVRSIISLEKRGYGKYEIVRTASDGSRLVLVWGPLDCCERWIAQHIEGNPAFTPVNPEGGEELS